MTIDAIEAGEFGEMCVHRKVAPIQIAFYCLADGKKMTVLTVTN